MASSKHSTVYKCMDCDASFNGYSNIQKCRKCGGSNIRKPDIENLKQMELDHKAMTVLRNPKFKIRIAPSWINDGKFAAWDMDFKDIIYEIDPSVAILKVAEHVKKITKQSNIGDNL